MLSGFQRYFCMQYTTHRKVCKDCRSCVIRISKILLYAIHNEELVYPPQLPLCYQDFKDTFVCNTQLNGLERALTDCCVIRISKILLYAIHNSSSTRRCNPRVVLSGFQRYFCMQYTTLYDPIHRKAALCYQDFKDTFVCNTQRFLIAYTLAISCVIRISKILLYAIHNYPYLHGL